MDCVTGKSLNKTLHGLPTMTHFLQQTTPSNNATPFEPMEADYIQTTTECDHISRNVLLVAIQGRNQSESMNVSQVGCKSVGMLPSSIRSDYEQEGLLLQSILKGKIAQKTVQGQRCRVCITSCHDQFTLTAALN